MEKLGIYDDKSLERRGDYKPKRKSHSKIHDYYLTIAGNLAGTEIVLTGISHAILLQMDFNNRIAIDNVIIDKLANKYKKKMGTFWSTINRMVKEGSLVRESAGHYFANPFYFTKTNFDKVTTLRAEWGAIMNNRVIEQIKSDKVFDRQVKYSLNKPLPKVEDKND